jgi:hypothetical protein
MAGTQTECDSGTICEVESLLLVEYQLVGFGQPLELGRYPDTFPLYLSVLPIGFGASARLKNPSRSFFSCSRAPLSM